MSRTLLVRLAAAEAAAKSELENLMSGEAAKSEYSAIRLALYSCGGRPLRAAALPANAAPKYALIHQLR